LLVDNPLDDTQQNVTFYITPPESDRFQANESFTWEGGTLTQLNLSANESAADGGAEDIIIDDNDGMEDDKDEEENEDANEEIDEPTVDENQSIDENTTTDETTDTAPGFGMFLTLISLGAVVLLSYHRAK